MTIMYTLRNLSDPEVRKINSQYMDVISGFWKIRKFYGEKQTAYDDGTLKQLGVWGAL